MRPEGLLAALAVGVAVATLARGCFHRRIALADRVRPYLVVVPGRGSVAPHRRVVRVDQDSGLLAVLADPFRRSLRGIAARLDSRSDDALALALEQAGRGTELPNEFRLAQAGGAVLHAMLFGAVALFAARTSLTAVLAATCGAIAGAARVRGRLDREVAQRAQRMELELYTLNQLLALHVRSGAGPMQAVQRIIDRCSGAVVEELASVIASVRNGMREPEAFRRAASRTPCPAASRTYVMFALAAERGSDLASALLTVGNDLRDARRESLRKHAVKQRAAMLAPTIGVLAPIMLLFVAAPLPSIVLGGH